MSLTTFAQRMKQSRENKGLKRNELAKIVGVTPTTISAYEKSDDEGNGKKPTLENAHAIAKALEVSLDWLCGKSTNYERIKAMSVEEMAEDITVFLMAHLNKYAKALGYDEMVLTAKEKEEIAKEWKQMLESEVSENDR